MPAPTASSRSEPGDAVDLDELAGSGGPATWARAHPAQRRGVALAVAAAVAASVTTGVVVQHRATAVARSAAQASAAATTPHLEVGYPEVRALATDGAPRARVVLPVVNTGDDVAAVTSVELTGRAGPTSMESPGLELAPGERARVAVVTDPQCALVPARASDVASLTVRTAGLTSTVSTQLAAPFGRPALEEQLLAVCGDSGAAGSVRAVVTLPDDRTLAMRLTNTSQRASEVSLRAARASGITSEPPLPLQLGAGAEVTVALTATPTCDTWSAGLASTAVDLVSSPRPVPGAAPRPEQASGWSPLLTSWVGGQAARACGGG